MSMVKSGISYGPLIISKMVLACKSCDHVEIVNEKDYSPNVERKCPKCQSIMVLRSSNTNTVNFTANAIDPSAPNMGGDYFDKPSKE